MILWALGQFSGAHHLGGPTTLSGPPLYEAHHFRGPNFVPNEKGPKLQRKLHVSRGEWSLGLTRLGGWGICIAPWWSSL